MIHISCPPKLEITGGVGRIDENRGYGVTWTRGVCTSGERLSGIRAEMDRSDDL